MTDEERQGAMVEVGPARLFVGLAQGTMLLALHGADEAQVWPATEHWLFVSLSCATLFVPLTVLAGLGGLRSTTLGLWTIVATAVVAGVASHSVLREIASGSESLSIPLLLCVAPALFIAYHLVAAADAERTLVASYRSYFDIGWKNGVQLALSIAFLGAFWLLLYLGAALFSLIKIDAIRQIIQNDWFSFPVSAVVFAAAVHLTDVRVGLISGARALALMLLSWLLPVMALFAIAFLLSLPFTGLEPLWATGSATFLLLTSAASLVVLINAAYQDGAQETPPPMVLRLGARLAALAIGPLVAIAGYSIWLRVEQYGLTPERVVGLAGIAVAGCYAVGYAVAALWPGRWLKPLEITNILTALVALGLIIALLTAIRRASRSTIRSGGFSVASFRPSNSISNSCASTRRATGLTRLSG